ncbi:agamous-like MADS-box protein AGL62 [Lotus japonicus]|uniref:agamous-like MADS-box protein AGL62 n=1 Tax=Lotus japonicus TaxID=34305 RepID=UPI002582EA8F|nr:agamous-like MADS-box protein AGL62 [Lotus japonicus]
MDVFQQKKKSTGRKKIEIKKLVKDANKQVTFSKRRAGLFKKASELCILCNVQMAIIVYSPADKLFSFGHPNTEAIVSRYLNGSTEFEPAKTRGRSGTYEEYNREYDEAIKVLEAQKKKLAEIETLAKVWNRGEWWNESIDEMGADQLEQFMLSIYALRGKLAERADQFPMMFARL